MRDHLVTPHIARKQTSIIDDRTTRHPGYLISQQKRKRVEEIFGWLKTVAGLRKTRHRGVGRVGWMFTFALAATGEAAQSGGGLIAPITTKGPKSSFRAIEKASDQPTNARDEPPHPD